MKSAAGTGGIRKKVVTRNGKEYVYWEARYTAGHDPGTGRQIQRSITGKTQKEVSRKLREATLAIEDGTYTAPNSMTVAAWANKWTRDYLGGVKPLTAKSYEAAVRTHIIPGLGAVRLDRLTTDQIQTFYNSLDLSPKTVRNVHGVLHKMLQQAVSSHILSYNAAEGAVIPKVEKPEIRPLEPQEVTAFLQAAEDTPYRNLFRVAVMTGMRQGELLGLRWSCVDFRHGTVLVNQQLQYKDKAYFFQSPKSGKGRTITPAPLAMDALRDERERQQAEKEAAMGCFQNQDGLVFTDALGKHLAPRTVDKHFHKVAEKAGISGVRFHDLRHTFAVSSLQAGENVKTVQENLGHATAAFTLDVYGHVTDQMKKESASRMQDYFSNLVREK